MKATENELKKSKDFPYVQGEVSTKSDKWSEFLWRMTFCSCKTRPLEVKSIRKGRNDQCN